MGAVAVLPSPAGVVWTQWEAAQAAAVTALAGAVLGALGGALSRRAGGGAAAGLLVALLWLLLPEVGSVVVRAPRPWLLACVTVGLGVAALGRAWHGVIWAVLLLDAGLLVGQAWPSVPPTAAGPPLLIVTLDTTRADALDPWSDATRTPQLAALAADAVVYTQAYAPVALTGPAHAALFAGQDDVLEQVSRNGLAVPPRTPWLFQALRDAGWDTRAVVSAAVLDERLGFCRGVSRCDTAFGDRLRRGHPLLRLWGWRSRAGLAVRRPDPDTTRLAAALWAEADTPALWVHLYGPHWPYTPSAAALAAEGLPADAALPDRGVPGLGPAAWTADEVALGARLYAAQMRDLDALIGDLVAMAGPDAAVVVVGDHGEGMGEHDDAFQHGRLPVSPATHVPLLVRCPGVPAARVDAPVSTASTWSLLAPCLGLPARPRAPVRSRTWASSHAPGVVDLGPLGGAAVRAGRWTLSVTVAQPLAAFDRQVDPHEVHPLPADAAPAALRGALDDALRVRSVNGEPVLPGEALEALGYVDP